MLATPLRSGPVDHFAIRSTLLVGAGRVIDGGHERRAMRR
jgi:hypothetical protein